MSAFIVSDETMHRVVQAMDLYAPSPDYLTKDDEANTMVGRMLFSMNNDAIRERYQDRYPDMFCDPQDYVYQPVEATTGELYRAVACFTYQCAEGSVPESELYKLVEMVERQLAGVITSDPVHSLTRSENAMRMTENLPWDF
jgi:hypothetical protein